MRAMRKKKDQVKESATDAGPGVADMSINQSVADMSMQQEEPKEPASLLMKKMLGMNPK
jgi:hypothetical protein